MSDADEGGSEPPTLSEEFPSQPSTPMTVADDAGRAGTPATEEDTNRAPWPSIGDLNNRLRRVITSYQRNFKKEELKLAQKAKVNMLTGKRVDDNYYYFFLKQLESLENIFQLRLFLSRAFFFSSSIAIVVRMAN